MHLYNGVYIKQIQIYVLSKCYVDIIKKEKHFHMQSLAKMKKKKNLEGQQHSHAQKINNNKY